MSSPTYYRLYVKFPEDKRFAPVAWGANRWVQVVNLIYASLFTSEEKEYLTTGDLAHPDNAHITWEFRKVSNG